MKKTYKLEGLGCANCAAKMEDGINKIMGVESATVNFLTQKMTINAKEEDIENILEQAKKIIKKYEPDVIVK